jgi:hypothetical protein
VTDSNEESTLAHAPRAPKPGEKPHSLILEPTSGTWISNAGGTAILPPVDHPFRKTPIANFVCYPKAFPEAEDTANLQLCLAAKDMLEFIRRWEHEMTDGGVLDQLQGWQREFAEEARALIAKARGER